MSGEICAELLLELFYRPDIVRPRWKIELKVPMMTIAPTKWSWFNDRLSDDALFIVFIGWYFAHLERRLVSSRYPYRLFYLLTPRYKIPHYHHLNSRSKVSCTSWTINHMIIVSLERIPLLSLHPCRYFSYISLSNTKCTSKTGT
jgi:hypothetical protein